MNLGTTAASMLVRTKLAAASLTDALAALGSRLPAVTQITASVAGVTVTVTPAAKPASAPPCSHCGRAPP